MGQAYNAVILASGGTRPYQFAIANGTLPPGLTINVNSGAISGTPRASGTYNFTVVATDLPHPDRGDHRFTITVSGNAPRGAKVSLTISPAAASVSSGGTLQFTATVRDTSNVGVTWSAGAGTVSNTGLFTAPAATSPQTVTVTATSMADPSATAGATVTVTPAATPPPPPPTPPPPPAPRPSGADNRYCDPGDVPNFGSSSDGPAAMPAACFHTATSATPSPGAVTQVAPSDSLQTAINNANCGDTLVLQAGQTYSGFSLPAKGCDAGHYITIRSSAAGAGLSAEGTRATPCNAGVSSLPGRPDLNCAFTSNVMARIAGAPAASQIIRNADGANYYRLIGLEVADTNSNGSGGYYDLVLLKNANHIILDRCWVHGTPTGEDVKGVQFENSAYIAVVDSYISDIHSKVSGWGADSAAIGSITGPGPVKIVNNFLEAAGENILWGGGGSSTNVSDIELRRNHFFKPFTWWQKHSTYFGTLFVVKNLFENKSGVRELVEANIFENNWQMAQKGTSILFYPVNQYGRCPGCSVHDVIFRYNIVRHVVSGISMSTNYATTCPGQPGGGIGNCLYPSGTLYNVSIHDNLLEDVSQSTYSPGSCCSGGVLFGIGTDQPANWPHDISIEHNSGFPDGAIFNVVIRAAPQVFSSFTFNNNLMGTGTYGFHTVLPGNGHPGCAGGAGALGTLAGCMGSTWTFSQNAFISASLPAPPSPYPSTPSCGTLSSCAQLFGNDWNAVRFANYNHGNGGDYRLLPTSPYKNQGTDGKDLGADMDTLLTVTAGVR